MGGATRLPESFFEGLPGHVVDTIHVLLHTVDDLKEILQEQQQTNEQLRVLNQKQVLQIQQQEELIQQQSQRIDELEGRSGRNSSNSSVPPSVEHPHAKTKTPKPKSAKKPGGQPGHPGHQRALLPSEKCSQIITCKPGVCSCCRNPLAGDDPEPLRHQVWEMPKIEPIITEYQRHRLTCSCGESTLADLPDGVPQGQAGARLTAFTATLMGLFRQSKRRTALFLESVLNIPASPAWVVILQERASEAMQGAYDELAKQLATQQSLSIDESPTKQGTVKAWIWTFVASCFTVFAYRTSRKAEVARQLIGEKFLGIIHCDRARMYWSLGRLQWCWAHLKRDFESWAASACRVKQRMGQALLRETLQMFAWWQKVRDGTITRAEFQSQMSAIRFEVERVLLRGCFQLETQSIANPLYDHRQWLWSFVDQEGIEPTNNAAEQALRQAVIWRKLSFGTQSESGSQFVERILTVVETCRRQKRDVLEWLTQTVQASFQKQKGPSLLPGA